jgi:hypothetical protein
MNGAGLWSKRRRKPWATRAALLAAGTTLLFGCARRQVGPAPGALETTPRPIGVAPGAVDPMAGVAQARDPLLEPMLEELRRSGAPVEDATPARAALADTLGRLGPDGRGAAPVCHRNGCYATVTFSSEAEHRRAGEAILVDRKSAFMSWPGSNGRTAVRKLPDGRYAATFFFLNPPPSERIKR